MNDVTKLREKKGFICDMDGVIYHGETLLPGVEKFVNWLKDSGKRFLFLTNSCNYVPEELQLRLRRMGLEVSKDNFYTSAKATAKYLETHAPGSSAYVIGNSGLFGELYSHGILMNEVNPDFVIVGESNGYDYSSITKAIRLVQNGAKLIGTHPDISGPSDGGIVPACGALAAPIELVTGKKAYYIGKPNPLMMRTGLHLLGCEPEDAVMVGDRMDTDILGGMEAGMDTVLVLSGVSTPWTIQQFAYRPKYVLDGVGDIAP